jgi:DNA-binding beta-propeller fold protein YncE
MASSTGSAPAVQGTTDKAAAKRPVIGNGEHTYEVYHDWGQLPAQIAYGRTHGIGIDRNGSVYVFHTVHATSQSSDAVVVFDPDGRFVKSWGKDFRDGAHGLHISAEGHEEFLYLCDIKRNVVTKTTLDGEEVFSLRYPEESAAYSPGPDGQRPKYTPTNVAIGPTGDIYVADGYGSNHIIQHDKGGKYLRTFGGEGDAPGKLKCPHGLMVDTRGKEPLLLVADRANNRLQYFTLDGQHVKFDFGVIYPCYFDTYGGDLLVPDLSARLTIMDVTNSVIVHLGEGLDDWKERRQLSRDNFIPGKFVCPHSACYDRDGNIFVAEWVEVGRVTKLRRVS